MTGLFRNTGEKHTFYVSPVGMIELAVYERVGVPNTVFYASAEIIARVSPAAKGKDSTFLRTARCKRSILEGAGLPAQDVRGVLPDDVVLRSYGYDYLDRLFMTAPVASVFLHYLVPDLATRLLDFQIKAV